MGGNTIAPNCPTIVVPSSVVQDDAISLSDCAKVVAETSDCGSKFFHTDQDLEPIQQLSLCFCEKDSGFCERTVSEIFDEYNLGNANYY